MDGWVEGRRVALCLWMEAKGRLGRSCGIYVARGGIHGLDAF